MAEDTNEGTLLSDAMVARVAARMRAMADETRIRLLLRLKHGPCGVKQLAEDLGVGQPSVSKHLAVLKQVGLLECERRGTQSLYSVSDKTIFDLCALVCEGVQRWVSAEHAALNLPQQMPEAISPTRTRSTQ